MKGHLSKRTAFVREIVKEVSGLAPYERRIIELLRNSKDKRARKLAKRRVRTSQPRYRAGLSMQSARLVMNSILTCNQLGTFGRAKRKVDDMTNVIAESRRAGH